MNCVADVSKVTHCGFNRNPFRVFRVACITLRVPLSHPSFPACQTHRKAVYTVLPAVKLDDTPNEQRRNVLPLRKEVRYHPRMSNEEIARSWSTYVNQVLGGMTDSEASERVPSVSPRTFGNWRNPDRCMPPDLRRVADFADRFGRPRAEALAAAGLPVDVEISGPQAVLKLDDVPTIDLLGEVMRREKDGGSHPSVITRGRRRRRKLRYDPEAPPV